MGTIWTFVVARSLARACLMIKIYIQDYTVPFGYSTQKKKQKKRKKGENTLSFFFLCLKLPKQEKLLLNLGVFFSFKSRDNNFMYMIIMFNCNYSTYLRPVKSQ